MFLGKLEGGHFQVEAIFFLKRCGYSKNCLQIISSNCKTLCMCEGEAKGKLKRLAGNWQMFTPALSTETSQTVDDVTKCCGLHIWMKQHIVK